jgi:uncharacterized membrane protein YvbJ
MPICVDCGEEQKEGESYCQYCGSPARVKLLTDQELRKHSIRYAPPGGKRKWFLLLFILFLLLFLLIFATILSNIVSNQIDKISGGL